MSDRIQEILERSREARERLAITEPTVSATLAPGELFVTRATADYPIQWALLRLEGADWRVVPADTWPVAERSDLAIVESASGAPLTLRLRHAVRVRADRLEVAARTGRLSGSDLAAARKRLAGLEAFAAEDGDLPSADAPLGLDHRRWLTGTVEPACAALREVAGGAPGATAPATPVRVWLYRAAVIALVVALGATGLGLRESRRTLENLRESRARIDQDHDRELEALRLAWLEEREARAQAEGVPVEPVPPVAAQGSVTSLPVALLFPRRLARGAEIETLLPGGASRMLVVLELDSPAPSGDLLLEIRAASGDGPALWRGPVSSDGGELRLAVELARPWTDPGDYRLRLLREDGDRDEPLAEYDLRLRSSTTRESP